MKTMRTYRDVFCWIQLMYDKGVEDVEDMMLLNHFHTSAVAVEWGVWEPGKENVVDPRIHIVDWRPCSEYLLYAMDEFVVRQETPEGKATFASQFSQFGVVNITADQDKNKCKATIHRVDNNPLFQNNGVKTWAVLVIGVGLRKPPKPDGELLVDFKSPPYTSDGRKNRVMLYLPDRDWEIQMLKERAAKELERVRDACGL